MLAKLASATLHGLDAKIIDVEINFSSGLPQTIIVGLADKSIFEARERVRACLKNSQLQYPIGRIAINLAPANILKYGTQFDLPIALGILAASGQISGEFGDKLLIGELSMDGLTRPIIGALAMVMQAKATGFKTVFVPEKNYSEASLVPGIEIIAIKNFSELLNYFVAGEMPPAPDPVVIKFSETEKIDFSEIVGQDFAKRGLEVALAGGHNILLKGAPGAGKTLLARAASFLLPPPSAEQILAMIKIYSAAGFLTEEIAIRPFRNPAQNISSAAFVGGGTIPKPGEISLAHGGILFLDEFAELPRAILESLRQPLESGEIKISRLHSNYIFPADFILIAAQNPCPCGFYGDEYKNCLCAPGEIRRYQKKISGPILDRIDLQIHVQRVDLFQQRKAAESSAQIMQRILRVRQIQKKRQGSKLNSRLSSAEIKQYCRFGLPGRQLLQAADKKYHFSARSFYRLIKLARTIADLAGFAEIKVEHLAEALQYRIAE